MNPFKGRHFQRDIILWADAGTGVTLPIFARGTWMKPT